MGSHLRSALRLWRRNPIEMIAAFVTLACVTVVGNATFSSADGLLFKPLGYRDEDQLLRLWALNVRTGRRVGPSVPDLIDWSEAPSILQASWYVERPVSVNGGQILRGVYAPADLFRLLGVRPVVGDIWRTEEEGKQTSEVAIVSHGVWQSLFGGTGAIGTRLVTDAGVVTVVGIMPAQFSFPYARSDIWLPPSQDGERAERGTRGNYQAIARLRDGAGLENGRTELTSISRRLAQHYPGTNDGWTASAVPLLEDVVGGDVEVGIVLMSVVAACLFLVGVSTASGLLLSVVNSRLPEFAVRSALGAPRRLLVRQVLAETAVVVAGAAALAHLLLPHFPALLRHLWPDPFGRLQDIAIDIRSYIFTAVVGLTAVVLCAVAPAMYVAGRSFVSTLNVYGSSHLRWSRAILALQSSACVAVVLTSVLVTKAYLGLAYRDIGFAPEGVIAVRLRPVGGFGKDREAMTLAYEEVLTRMKGAGALHASATDTPPYGPVRTVVKATTGKGSDGYSLERRHVLPAYFETLGATITEGRDFNRMDRTGWPLVAILDTTAARDMFPGQSALGHYVYLAGFRYEVIGVASAMRHSSVAAPPAPAIYLPLLQSPPRQVSALVRVRDTTAALPEVAMIKTGGFLAQSSPTKIADDVASTLRYEKFRAVLLAVLGGIAWLLGAVGVVVVVATTVRRSAREIAIRRALGAQSWDIVRVSSARVLLPLTMGSVVGLGIVVALRSASRSVLLSVPTIDAMSIAIVVLLLGVMAGTAGIFPIRSALLSLPADLLRRDS